jgi:hypothetical protein
MARVHTADTWAAGCVGIQAVTAKDNVERLLKRQISQYKTHRDPVTGTETPPKMEVQGSHSVNCEELPEGCR